MHLLKRVVFYAVVIALVIFAALPFYWMFITAFKTERDLYNLKAIPYIFNEPPTLQHVDLLFNRTAFVQWLQNTFVVGGLVVIITLLIAIPAGYALARLAGRYSEPLGIGMFLTYLVPPTLLFIPLSPVISRLGLQDSLWALVVIYPTFTIPFCTWLMMGFFKTIPIEIEEAAWIDGDSRIGTLIHVVLPVSLPGIFTIVIFAFTLCVQEFVYALTFISSTANKTITVGVPTDLMRGDLFFWGSLMAAALIAGIPVAIVYNLFLDRFLVGITGGAIR
ncbi:MAG: carbohydrate ABC transporter permease [Anaerolineae bacterium]|nr:carbohydrate ABC transporter permease [Anaerolineae bacterium]